jgi:SAM-dependent methyltransferase
VADLSQADRRGPLFEEARRLALPLPWWSPARWQWALARAGIRLAACFSDGIRLGWRTGFDSGSTLDHVYRNQAQGRTVLGRAIDRLFLQSTVSRSLRQRRLGLQALLDAAMASVRQRGLPVRLIDIAAGPGRYLLDAAMRIEPPPESILLCDHSALSVREARGLIAERGLQHMASAIEADALSPEGLAGLAAAPTIAVVSGLYEHVPDNTLVARSLAALHAAMPAGGHLLYTNQPWQPQLELMARAMPSHRDGALLRMRRRSQLEIDQLVQAAGFSKLAQRIDADGLFSVSLAVR